jgi:diaminopimelate epimerase
MFIDFEKWHGTKNDFVVTWIADTDDLILGSLKRQAAAICDRRSGIGADGILVLHTKQRGDLTPERLTIINSDGSIAKNCGNGLRCAALSILKTHLETGNPNEIPEACELEVEGVPILCRFLDNRTLKTLVAVEMPVAKSGSDVGWGAVALKAADAHITSIGLGRKDYQLEVCDLGNPHLVVNTDQASRDLMLRIGPQLQDKCGIDGINVHVVRPVELKDAEKADARRQLGDSVSELYKMFVWERGAGETMACGTGACAVAVSALSSGLTERSEWIAVDMPGGRVYVKQESPDEPVTLAGPATFVFAGKLEI